MTREPAALHLLLAVLATSLSAAVPASLPATQPLTGTGDLSAAMVAGLHRRLDTLTREVVTERSARWDQRVTSSGRTEHLLQTRATLARITGIIDPRVSPARLELLASPTFDGTAAESDRLRVLAVRWPVVGEVRAEGLLLQPKGPPRAVVIALPDADQTPEMISGLAPGVPPERQYARRLAEAGCLVLVPTLLDRSDAESGNAAIGRLTNQPHREWIYRQAFALGRHPLGLEVQTVQAGLEALLGTHGDLRAGVAGWGEGALVAFLTGALDERFAVTAVSGHFGPREGLFAEPIYRNVFGLLRTAGDAELAQLILPRALVIEPAAAPAIDGPPNPRPNAAGAAPGAIRTPVAADFEREIGRARRLAGAAAGSLIVTPPAPRASPDFFSDETLRALLDRLAPGASLPAVGVALADRRTDHSAVRRQARLVRAWESFLQAQIAASRATRDERFWKPTPVSTPEAWAEAMRPQRERFSTETIGHVAPTATDLNPRSRPLLEKPGWTAHEVVLDVAPDVFAWGYLLQPADLRPGERRPVVVAQHGLEGVPAEVIDEDSSTRAFSTYKAFAVRLVERGFIVFAPHNPYRGPDFRQLQRKAHPLGLSLFSFITAQHERILDWLGGLPQVDPDRIGFYGLSYGGSTAVRVPAIITRYAAVVCSGNFNEWVWKLSTTSWPGSYVFTREYEMPEFDLAGTFNHAEMAALIAPRPFMVERGHADGVGIDEWVSFEYAKVRRLYDRLGVPDRTQIEYFNGPHTIHGVGTYSFLHRHLAWPEPKR